MQQNSKLAPTKLARKLDFLSKSLTYDLSNQQKDQIRTQLELFTKTLEHLQGLSAPNELVESFYDNLSSNLSNLKKKVIAELKLQSRDIDLFKFLQQEKGKGWIPMLEILPVPPRVADIRERGLEELGFPCMSYTNQELCQFAKQIFEEQNILEEFNLPSDKLDSTILKICGEYNVPAYHNFSHGFNVFQTFYFLLKRTGFESFLSKTEIFATLVATLGHDINHRGYNNAYEIKLRTKNALAYYDDSILENMHVSVLISVLKDPDIALFDYFTDLDARTQFKELIVSLILATDMAKHHKALNKFTKRVQATVAQRQGILENHTAHKSSDESPFNFENTKDKRKILKSMVHACDLGVPCQKYDSYVFWCALVVQEFDSQVIKEEKKGVEVYTFMKYTNQANFYMSQITFSQNLALPLWEQIAALFEGANEAVDNIKSNIKRLHEEKEKAEKLESPV